MYVYRIDLIFVAAKNVLKDEFSRPPSKIVHNHNSQKRFGKAEFHKLRMTKNFLSLQESVASPRRIVCRALHQGTVVEGREELAGVREKAPEGGEEGEYGAGGALILARLARPVQAQVSARHCRRQKNLWLHRCIFSEVKEKMRL